jgi:iron complex outermembrane recepter protein
MRTGFLLSLALMLLNSIAFCQDTWSISGRITDQKSYPLSGVSLNLLNTNFGVFSDKSGNFQISHIPAGRYILHITAVGFASEDRVVVSGGARQELNVELAREATQLGEVVVTAQKKEELLQQVPLSISVLSSKQIEEFRVWNSKDLTAIVPNLYSANPGDNRNVTSLRGVGSTSYDPAIATYIDGVNQFSLDTYIAQLYDIERIEVLRGPQGTLYGRNAMGGVVNIITKQPSNHTDGFVEITSGNYGQQRIAAAVRLPLIKNKLFLGVSGMFDYLDGYYTNRFNNTKFDRQHSLAGNYYLKWLASSHWALILNVKQQVNRNNGVFPLAGSLKDAFANPFTVNQNAVTKIIDNIFNSSLSVSYHGPVFDFSSQTAYQSNYRYYKDPIDGDFSPLDAITIIDNYGKPWNKVKVLTQEFRLASPGASLSPFRWTAGTYLFYQNSPNKQATRFGKDAGFIGSSDSLFSIITSSTSKRTGFAFYGQVTYNLSSRLEMTAGLRYDFENDRMNVLGEFQHDPNPNPVFAIRPDTSGSALFSAGSPKLSFEYHVSPHNNLFVVYSRGYRTGGLTQLSSDPSQPPLYAYKPEYSDNIEIGSKNNFLQNRLRLNIAAFYTTITNAQVPTLILPDAITVTKNAGRLDSKGVELELEATPLKGLEATYNFGYTHATYQALKLSQNGTVSDLGGNRQIFTPDVTSLLALQYGYGLAKKRILQLVIRGEWIYLGQQYFDLANTIKQSPYSLFNTRFGIASRHFEMMFWGRNLGNKKYISYAYDFGAVHLGNSFSFGVTFTAKL